MNFDRRTFLRTGVTGVAGVGLAGCSGNGNGGNGNGNGGNGGGNGDGGNGGGNGDGDDGSDGGSGGSDYPSQDIEMIVPWASGGGTDRTGRKLAELASEELDPSVYVSNVTGGTGSVGHREMANAEPNGYTIGTLDITITQIEHMGIADINHEEFSPILQYNNDPAAITVSEDAEWDTIGDFVAAAEENPGEISISNAGTGGVWHIAAAGFAQEAGVEFEHIPYDGGNPAAQAVLGGEVDATAASAVEVRPLLDEGLKLLAVMSEEPLDWADAPTLQEEDIDWSFGAWRGLGAPLDVPQERLDFLEETFNTVYESEEFQSFMEEQGFGTVYRPSDEFGDFMDEQYETMGTLIENLGLNE
jgi:tripartite-type tricarboxylate transporter receptor subunit TctC